jgi:hypothetical protein
LWWATGRSRSGRWWWTGCHPAWRTAPCTSTN